MTFQPLPGLTGPLPPELVVVVHGVNEYALDVVALTSNWQCIYGRGCKGTTPIGGERPERYRPPDQAVGGCCRVAPGYAVAASAVDAADAHLLDSPMRIKRWVDELEPGEAQHYDQIAAGAWYVETQQDDGSTLTHNSAVGGNCIFLNTDGPNGKLGCAMYHVAVRLGVDPKHTRPAICHIEPAAAFLIADDLASGGERVLVTLRPGWYGWFAAEGYFCTADPAAHSAAEPVFRRMASEFSTLLGEPVYAALLPTLEEIWVERGKRLKSNWGRPVPLPAPTWAR